MPTRTSTALLIVALVAMVMMASLWSSAPRSAATGGPGIVSVGYDHTCALLETGGVQCLGSNVSGQLGDGTTTSSSSPVDVCGVGGCGTQLSGVRSVSSGREHSCVLTTVGGVQCWGANTLMQLGNGTTANSSTPVNVTGLSSGVAQLSAGRYYTCVVTNSGGVKCWGSNYYGQLGDGTNVDHGVPMDVSGLPSGVVSVETERYHACALMATGKVKCWGDNVDGQLGNPGVEATNQPVGVCAKDDCSVLLQDVAAVSLGIHSTCALMLGGGVKCWGKNDFGQLGNGSVVPSAIPVDVVGLTSGVSAISVGEANVCARPSSGISAVKCWGDNRFGQLGNGTTVNSGYPSEVCADATCTSPLASAAAVSVGAHQACAVATDGGVKCWGLNSSGQLGDGTTTQREAPVHALLSGVKPIPMPTRTATAVPATATPTPEGSSGDANCDHRVNSIDAALVLQRTAGLLSALPCASGADVNHDGRVGSIDAALILQYVAGLLPDL